MVANRKKVVVIASLAWSLLNFRIELLRRMVANGYEVLALAPDFDATIVTALEANGIRFAKIDMDRTGTNPLNDLRSLWSIYRILRRENPDIVVPYTMKPIIYGCMAARFAGVPNRFALFTGLGYMFTDPDPKGRRRLIRTVTVWLHRVALRGVQKVFYYNTQEERDIRGMRLAPPDARLVHVPGSGVDTQLFSHSEPSSAPVKFLFVGRLLRSKGLEVLIDAVRQMRREGVHPDVSVLGPFDTNPDAIDRGEIEAWCAEGLIAYLGETRDVRPFLKDCSVMVLPTQLREGIPRTILEAMASGRAVITTDMPGCGEAIRNGETGLVCPAGDSAALAVAMRRFLDQPELVKAMGGAARAHACEVYDVHKINRLLLAEMGMEQDDAVILAAT